MNKILITGGAGFIGLNLSVELINLGYEVVVIDDLKNAYKTHIDSLIKIFGDKIKFYKIFGGKNYGTSGSWNG